MQAQEVTTPCQPKAKVTRPRKSILNSEPIKETPTNPGEEHALEVARLTQAQAKEGRTMTQEEVKFAVSNFYQQQNSRIRFTLQAKALERDGKQNAVLTYLRDQQQVLEKQLARPIEQYVKAHPMGDWLLNVFGIGPLIAGGMLAHFDITKARTAGAFWRYAGMDPTADKRTKGEKLQYNPEAKTLMRKAAESFVMHSNKEKCFYGEIYRTRKEQEWARNMDGEYTSQALAAAERVGKGTQTYLYNAGCLTPRIIEDMRALGLTAERQAQYLKDNALVPLSGVPMLSPDHLHSRAMRFTAKVFLHHFFEAWWRKTRKDAPPVPYFIAILNHAHEIGDPQFDKKILSGPYTE